MYYYSMNNNGMSKFLNKQNIDLLWDVLLDELRVDRNNKQIFTNIRAVFESNINPFTKNANANTFPLVNLNKQFLSQVVIAVNRLFPNLKQEQDFKRIQISSEDVFEPYKVEDIHSERQNNFEKQVQQKRSEFEKSINLNKPAELDFTEKIDDGKIKEMDTLIAETMARRKFDIEQIQNNFNTEDPENWLQPQQTQTQTQTKTLPKTKKQEKEKVNEDFDLGIYRKLKLKPIDTNTSKKNVTWTDQQLTGGTNENISLQIEEVEPDKFVPDKFVPDKFVPDKFVPDKLVPDKLVPDKLVPDKLDILIDKIDILINIMTNFTKQSSDPTCSEINNI